ncbi:GntR family transcriptional regulator [Stappia sp.]|jgi:DNA-binding GntR family transcriptional regulator|uniref:GntR family transcriptional regulator n=1 Tax=Stappia sp. TaxID=1870903 RepID=UPI003A990AC4
MNEQIKLRTLDLTRGPSVTDLVFQELYDRVVGLDLLPGTKLSEADVARRMGVSRQPVRDAFYRLSQQGFLLVRPQRATVVTPISVEAVLRARFVRTALELEIMRAAMANVDGAALTDLADLIAQQRLAVEDDDRPGFHALDDAFHNRICELAGHGHVWALIRDNKAHMDRVRYLSLENGARLALVDHVEILEAMRDGDETLAISRMRAHLSRIAGIISEIRAAHADFFDPDEFEPA